MKSFFLLLAVVLWVPFEVLYNVFVPDENSAVAEFLLDAWRRAERRRK